jgi:glycosyltransferase involved in cell wall biosynthesis
VEDEYKTKPEREGAILGNHNQAADLNTQQTQSGSSRPQTGQTILSLVSSEGHFGIENLMVSLAKSLTQYGCRNIVGVFQDSRRPHLEVAEEARRAGLEVEILPCRGRWDSRTVAEIRQLVRKYNVNVLNPHGYKADLYAHAAARRQRVAVVPTVHNWPSKLFTMRVYAAIDRLVLRGSNKVVVVSSRVAQILRRWRVSNDKVVLIDNGVDLRTFSNVSPTLLSRSGEDNRPIVGFVGRHVADKGGAFLLRAAKTVLETFPRALFVFVGDGEVRNEWEALAVELGIQDSVRFTGVRKDMPGVYASLDVMVLPSLMESMPMCLLEAMASGKPVVATRVGEIPRAVIPEETGLLVKPRDIAGLAGAILRLLKDPSFAQRIGANAQAHVSRHFSAQAMAKSYIEVYEQVLSGKRTGLNGAAALELSC